MVTETLLLLLLRCFSHVRLCATPEMEAHQAPPSLGFSRQEHWSGLPFHSPVHESESEVTQSCPTQWPHGLQPTRLLHPWDFPGKSTGVGCHCLLQYITIVVFTFNSNKFNGAKQHKYIILQFWRWKVRKGFHWTMISQQDCAPFQAL